MQSHQQYHTCQHVRLKILDTENAEVSQEICKG